MHLFKLLTLFWSIWLLNYVLTAEITQNTISRGQVGIDFAGITISPNVFWSVIDNFILEIIGHVKINSGSGFYVQSNSNSIALRISLLGLIFNFENDGIISFNAHQSIIAPTYRILANSFVNNGEFYLSGDATLGVPNYELHALTWRNTGLVVIYQNFRSNAITTLGNPGGSVINTGTICLNNIEYQQTTAVFGSGCIVLQGKSTLLLPNALLVFATGQNILMENEESSIVVEALSTPQTFRVHGFGSGNKLALTTTLAGTLLHGAYSYDTKTGILTLYTLALSQKFNIGLGYNSNLFYITTETSGLVPTVSNAIAYSGKPPTTARPSACMVCKPQPESPGNKPVIFESTITQITDTETLTRSAQILVSTNTAGSWFTSTSYHPTSIDIISTTYTTLFNEISNHQVLTRSGIVVVGSDTEWFTSTSVFPYRTFNEYTTTNNEGYLVKLVETTTTSGEWVTLTSTITPEFTHYSSTLTLVEDGTTSYDAIEIFVTTNDEGSWTTITNDIPEEYTRYTTTVYGFNTALMSRTQAAWEVLISTNSAGQWFTTSNTIGPTFTSYTFTQTVIHDGQLSVTTNIRLVTTNEDGSWTTLYRSIEPTFETYETTYLTTNDVGDYETVTASVVVSTNGNGQWYTSTYKQRYTTYTTTYVTTDSNSVTHTASAQVIVSNDPENNWFTTSSIIPQSPTEYTSIVVYTEESTTYTSVVEVIVTTDENNEWHTTTTIPQNEPMEESQSAMTYYFSDSNDIYVIVISQNSNGEIFTRVDSIQAFYTSFTTTITQPSTTYQAVIVETTNNARSLYRTTSIIPAPTITTFTTLYPTTNAEGDLITAIGEILITTNSEGSYITHSSALPTSLTRFIIPFVDKSGTSSETYQVSVLITTDLYGDWFTGIYRIWTTILTSVNELGSSTTITSTIAGESIETESEVFASVTDTGESTSNTETESALESTIITATDSALETEVKTASETEVETAFETEVESTINTETNSALETETDSALETELETAIDTETESAIETEVESTIETEIESTIETESEPGIETEVDSAIETESESAVETEIEFATETEMESAIETETESEIESTIETETESVVETEIESAIETEMESAIETETESEIESTIETEIESVVETEIESAIETEMESAIETETESEIESTIETAVESANETEVESTIESEIESAVETEIETVIATQIDSAIETEIDSAIVTESESGIDTETESALETKIDFETEIDTAIETETESTINTDIESALETEVESIINTETDSALESTINSESDVALETEIDPASETEIDLTSETEVESSIDAETESAAETEIESATETGMGPATESEIEFEIESTIETEMESTIETERESEIELPLVTDTESAIETKIESETETAIETKVDSAIDTDTESAIVTEVESAIETEIESTTNIDFVESAIETEVESAFLTESESTIHTETDTEFESLIDTEIKLALETETASAINTETESVLEAGVGSAIETKLDSAIETGTESTINTDIESALETKVDSAIDTEIDTAIETEVESTIDIETNLSTATDALEIKTELATEREIESEIEYATETEVDTTIDTDVDTTIDTEIKSTIETEANSATETEIESAIDPETETTFDTETESAINTEVDAASNTEIDSAIITETDFTLETEIKSGFETEVESAIGTEVESTINTEIESAIETKIESFIDTEVESAINTETDDLLKTEIDSTLETEITDSITTGNSASTGIEIDSALGTGTDFAIDTEIESSNETDIESTNDTDTDSPLETEIASATNLASSTNDIAESEINSIENIGASIGGQTTEIVTAESSTVVPETSIMSLVASETIHLTIGAGLESNFESNDNPATTSIFNISEPTTISPDVTNEIGEISFDANLESFNQSESFVNTIDQSESFVNTIDSITALRTSNGISESTQSAETFYTDTPESFETNSEVILNKTPASIEPNEFVVFTSSETKTIGSNIYQATSNIEPVEFWSTTTESGISGYTRGSSEEISTTWVESIESFNGNGNLSAYSTFLSKFISSANAISSHSFEISTNFLVDGESSNLYMIMESESFTIDFNYQISTDDRGATFHQPESTTIGGVQINFTSIDIAESSFISGQISSDITIDASSVNIKSALVETSDAANSLLNSINYPLMSETDPGIAITDSNSVTLESLSNIGVTSFDYDSSSSTTENLSIDVITQVVTDTNNSLVVQMVQEVTNTNSETSSIIRSFETNITSFRVIMSSSGIQFSESIYVVIISTDVEGQWFTSIDGIPATLATEMVDASKIFSTYYSHESLETSIASLQIGRESDLETSGYKTTYNIMFTSVQPDGNTITSTYNVELSTEGNATYIRTANNAQETKASSSSLQGVGDGNFSMAVDSKASSQASSILLASVTSKDGQSLSHDQIFSTAEVGNSSLDPSKSQVVSTYANISSSTSDSMSQKPDDSPSQDSVNPMNVFAPISTSSIFETSIANPTEFSSGSKDVIPSLLITIFISFVIVVI
ncbi:uncharacterized protein KGF55_001298 [Candida pseudojiufengensis]|uniref:uncharacterized protein n=1 Tax=Candida pseudojiufengensis TaxID=497109 RepID=UPI0022244614|nr:uncharacterized protein KGF55_001298 [Candida pseudojiufengensis]KAI5965934.1 hypothetical protein KGF55_001298 [Candida pseudojiufengensis]